MGQRREQKRACHGMEQKKRHERCRCTQSPCSRLNMAALKTRRGVQNALHVTLDELTQVERGIRLPGLSAATLELENEAEWGGMGSGSVGWM